MRAVMVVAGILMVAAVSACAEEWPLRLEEIWQTPGKDEPVFAAGFPPPEIQAVLADTSIPQEDKEWFLNQIRHWAAYRTKQLWLDDGTTMEIPVVKLGDKVRVFTVYKSRNMKYWLVRAMRIEGPKIPPEPAPPPGGVLTPEFGEAKSARLNAQWQQKAHWREAFMDVEGRIYWEKEFGPYDTYLEDSWIGDVGVYISDDGEVVVKTSPRKSWFCGKNGECVEREGPGYARMALSADGSTFVVHTGTRFSTESRLAAFDRLGQRMWTSDPVEGKEGDVVSCSGDAGVSVFSVIEPLLGSSRKQPMHLVGPAGQIVAGFSIDGEVPRGASFCRGDSVAILVFARSVVGADAVSGKELWKYRLEPGWEGNLMKVSSARDLAVLSACTDRRCTPSKGELFVLSGHGRPLYRAQRPKTEVFLSPSGALLLEKAGGLKFSRLVLAE